MNITKERYGGRLVGLLDALGMKCCPNLTPEQYFQLSEMERQKFSLLGMENEKCQGVVSDLRRLSLSSRDSNSVQEQIREYKIGLREGIMMVRHNEDLMKLTLPVRFLD